MQLRLLSESSPVWTVPAVLVSTSWSLLRVFVTLHCTHFRMPICLLEVGAQDWTQHSRSASPGLVRGGVSHPFYLLTALLMEHKRLKARCWLMFNLWSSRALRSFSLDLLSEQLHQLFLGVILPQAEVFALPTLNVITHFTFPLTLTWSVVQPSDLSLTSVCFSFLSRYADRALCLSSRLLMKILNGIVLIHSYTPGVQQ